MIRVVFLVALLAPVQPVAQPAASSLVQHAGHAGMTTMPPQEAPAKPAGLVPTQPGQGAFAAIQEIVAILEADPHTDWAKVNIDSLRQHLVDMNNVTLAATVTDAPIDGGMRFDVTGEGAVRDSVRRMIFAHAAAMNGVDGWTFGAKEIDGGAELTARAPPGERNKLKGLGFFGILALGMHHQAHHLMIARGMNPHQ